MAPGFGRRCWRRGDERKVIQTGGRIGPRAFAARTRSALFSGRNLSPEGIKIRSNIVLPFAAGASQAMTQQPDPIEAVRTKFRPERIVTLFVGESAPHSGAFFYLGNTSMARNMKRAMSDAGLSAGGDFLERFKAYGWYLDDLVLAPINHLPPSSRKQRWRQSQQSLANRIAEYRPRAILTLLLGIRAVIESAATAAGSDAAFFAVPFPGNGQQERFRREIARILPLLPKGLVGPLL